MCICVNICIYNHEYGYVQLTNDDDASDCKTTSHSPFSPQAFPTRLVSGTGIGRSSSDSFPQTHQSGKQWRKKHTTDTRNTSKNSSRLTQLWFVLLFNYITEFIMRDGWDMNWDGSSMLYFYSLMFKITLLFMCSYSYFCIQIFHIIFRISRSHSLT